MFSLEIGVNPFFYGHGLKVPKIISYAGSFGPTTMEQIQISRLQDLIQAGFNNMSALSARDQNTKEIMKKLSGRNVEIVCDPVILYGYKNEMSEYKPNLQNYMIVYSYDKNMNDNEEVKFIKAYAKKNNLKTVAIAYHHSWCDYQINASPNELLGWIKNAELVVTDTFHGAVISLCTNTPMAVKICRNQNKLEFLLEQYGLTGRIMSNISEIEMVAKKPMNFELLNQALEEQREYSLKFLSQALEE